MKHIFLLSLALFFGCFLIYPLTGLFAGAFFVTGADHHTVFTLQFFQLLLENRLYRLSIVNSFEIALLTALFTALVSIPLAVLFTRCRFPGREIFRSALLAPLILPPFVGALGLKHIFARYGACNLLLAKLGCISLAHPIDWFGTSGFAGIVILQVLHLFPIFFLSVSAALANIDPSLTDAAANLGASAWRLLLTVTLPLTRPGLFAGGCIVFISAFTDLGTPLIFNYTATVPTQIFNASVDPNGEQIGYALVVATLALVLFFFLLVRRFGETSVSLMSARASYAATEIDLPPFAAWGATVAVGALLLLALLPHLGVIISSFAERWFFTILPSKYSLCFYADVFTTGINGRFVTNSLLYSSLSAFLDLVLGLVIAHLLAREKFPGKPVLDALAMLPLALPGLVLAFGLLTGFNFRGWGEWINPRADPTFLLVISYALRRLPYIVRAAYAGYQQTSITLEEAAANLGAGRWRTFTSVTFPLIAPSLIAGTILTFCFAMLEVSDSLVLVAEARFAPITRGIYEIMGRPSPDSAGLACALGVFAMALLGGGMLWGSRLMGRRLGGFFSDMRVLSLTVLFFTGPVITALAQTSQSAPATPAPVTVGDPFSDPLIQQVQKRHQKAVNGDKEETKSLTADLETWTKEQPNNHLLQAYLGSVYTLDSRDAWIGPGKLTYLENGGKELDAAVAADPHNPAVRFVRAIDYFELPAIFGKRQIARNDFQILVRQIEGLLPNAYNLNADTRQAIYYYAGLSYKQLSQPKDARGAWERGLKLGPTSALGIKMQAELSRLD